MTSIDEKYKAPALEKGLDIIELLAEYENGLTQIEIARAMGRSVGEIFRMLIVLQRRGYVSFDTHSDRYGLTTKLFEVANQTPIVKRLSILAGPLMRKLANKINQSVHLALYSDGHILVIGQVDNPGSNIMAVRLGARIPVWRASSGRVIMAFSNSADLDEVLSEYPPEQGDVDTLKAELSKINKRGYEENRSFIINGITNMSVPIFDHSNHAIASMTIPWIDRLDSDNNKKEGRESLIEIGSQLSKLLGNID